MPDVATTKMPALSEKCKPEVRGSIFVSDGWQNVRREHITGSILTLFGKSLRFGVHEDGDRHDGIAIAVQLEPILVQAIAEDWNVGCMITDDAGQCRRARQILSLRWPKISFIFCFAHDINNLVKDVLKTSFSQITREASAAVNAVNNSVKWLRRARNLMNKMYGYELSLCSLCVTRWNSMQACFASLSRVKSALEMLARQCHEDDDFPRDLAVFLKDYFWSDLKRVERVIAPLSLASYRLQRDENTLGDVIKSYADIFAGFKQAPQYSKQLIECVEKRWKKCEQPLFMLFIQHTLQKIGSCSQHRFLASESFASSPCITTDGSSASLGALASRSNALTISFRIVVEVHNECIPRLTECHPLWHSALARSFLRRIPSELMKSPM
ncbi:hypothetical protein F441_06435 [Phytophthora nicotianae CJ01A1]|uniref:Uncharacterized protein n=1 Tax=Phytophthora nicotianae CJ01A1 TaxID=1317063 RepID=W2XB91_PHYNI|nr:hypothetical protein F441_06435 [Phytophthora nicotianae CJ01A1]